MRESTAPAARSGFSHHDLCAAVSRIAYRVDADEPRQPGLSVANQEAFLHQRCAGALAITTGAGGAPPDSDRRTTLTGNQIKILAAAIIGMR